MEQIPRDRGPQITGAGQDREKGSKNMFIYIATGSSVCAWDLPRLPNQKIVDVGKYREFILRAVLEGLSLSRYRSPF